MDKVFIATRSWYENIAYGDYDEREIIGVFDAPCKATRCIVEEMETNDYFKGDAVMNDDKNKCSVEKAISVLDEERLLVIETDYEYVYYAITEYEVQ